MYLRWSSSESKACFRSCVILASIVVMFSRMPRNVIDLEGRSKPLRILGGSGGMLPQESFKNLGININFGEILL